MKNTKYTTISLSEADEQEAVPITTGYKPEEYDLLDKAIATLGRKAFVLIRTRDGIVIARPQTELKLANA